MRNRLLTVLFVIIALTLFISACSSGAPASTAAPAVTSSTSLDGATLVQERCSVCHPLSRIESARHTSAEWTYIVGMMISRGAQLNSSEETAVIGYLTANFGK